MHSPQGLRVKEICSRKDPGLQFGTRWVFRETVPEEIHTPVLDIGNRKIERLETDTRLSPPSGIGLVKVDLDIWLPAPIRYPESVVTCSMNFTVVVDNDLIIGLMDVISRQ